MLVMPAYLHVCQTHFENRDIARGSGPGQCLWCKYTQAAQAQKPFFGSEHHVEPLSGGACLEPARQLPCKFCAVLVALPMSTTPSLWQAPACPEGSVQFNAVHYLINSLGSSHR